MRKKYLVLLLIPLLIGLTGCGKKKYVAPLPGLNAPSNLTTTAITYKQINLSWEDNSTIEDGFRVCCDMGGSQYQTVDTVPPNTPSFEHYNLQPMTAHTYYIQAYRGNEYANSSQVSASTPCPIQILNSNIGAFSIWGVAVYVTVKNDATERCETELKATFYDPNGNAYGSMNDNFIMAAGETRKVSITYSRYEQFIMPGYSVEVTKAKILY